VSTLVFLEHDGTQIDAACLGVLTKATSLGDGAVGAVLVGGTGTAALAPQAAACGATTVFVAEDEVFAAPRSQPRVDVLEEVAKTGGYDTIWFSNSVLAADVAAGLSARMAAGLNWDLVDIERRDGQLVGKRLALGDSVLVEVSWRSACQIALFRTGSFEAQSTGAAEPEIRTVNTTPRPYSLAASIVEHVPKTDEGPALEDAEVIVTGGMGLGGPEHFALAERLAEILGGVVGATRAVVYAGWCPSSMQIGQTGKTVSPKLYIALGVSGAVQHRVGMQRSKTIVAINKDPNAPIFEFCDLAVVGDVHTIVPALIDLIGQRKGT